MLLVRWAISNNVLFILFCAISGRVHSFLCLFHPISFVSRFTMAILPMMTDVLCLFVLLLEAKTSCRLLFQSIFLFGNLTLLCLSGPYQSQSLGKVSARHTCLACIFKLGFQFFIFRLLALTLPWRPNVRVSRTKRFHPPTRNARMLCLTPLLYLVISTFLKILHRFWSHEFMAVPLLSNPLTVFLNPTFGV